MFYILGIIAIVLVYSIFMLIRNEWVSTKRTNLIDEFFDKKIQMIRRGEIPSYDNNWNDDYLSYDEMMRKFWVWDIEKLRK